MDWRIGEVVHIDLAIAFERGCVLPSREAFVYSRLDMSP